MIVQHNWDEGLFPIYDIIRHCNDKWINKVITNFHSDTGAQIYTYREINVGEDVYTDHYFFNINAYSEKWDSSYGTTKQFHDH